jgi:hypothetical protein
MVREAVGLTAGGGNDINVRVAVVVPGESNTRSIRRKDRARFFANVRRKAAGSTSAPADDPQIVTVDENHVSGARRGLPQKRRAFRLGLDRTGESAERQERTDC